MQYESADELDIKMHHFPFHRLIADGESVPSLCEPAGGIFYNRERFRQNLVGTFSPLPPRGPVSQSLLPTRRQSAQFIIRETLKCPFQLVDLMDDRRHSPDLALIFRT